ncbi:MAG TPA: Nif3-like dinuclear metal center hexameric protein [Vicinamibacterales bacterium]
MTAQEVVTRIQQALAADGIAWREPTVDTFKAGRPETSVRGIATTGMATLDVLHRAAAAGRNFVITHEPTFYNHLDQTAALEADTTYQAKLAFIGDQKLVVWRFHDHAHRMHPDPLVAGSARTLGLAQYVSPSERGIYVVPETTLRALAADIAKRLGGRAIRVCGDPQMKVTRISMGPGYGVPALTQAIDVSIGGESPESGGNAEYALDAHALGRQRGVILLGHMMSEDWGMREVADWLHRIVNGVPIEWLPAGEPFGPPRA